MKRPSNIRPSALLILAALACSLIGFSGLDWGSGTAPVNNRAPNPLDAIYAPFDTLRTNLADYIWPTNASTVITSSFADYRRTHLHEGIDISTNNQTGYPVYAVREGYVSRIFIDRRGYGKMLYVRHPDGFVTMYAHLQKFVAPIDAYVKKLQKHDRRYTLEVDLDSTFYPVSKGDLIAYTGATGIGSAHLHFEVRDSSLNPINPFLLPQISAAISDEISPDFHTVAFTPLAGSAKILGKHRVWLEDAKKEGPGSYVLPRPLTFSGAIGISVRVTDQSDVLKYRTGAYKFEMYIDGQPFFTLAKKFILSSEDHQVAAYYDKGLLRLRRGRFEKLYIEPGNRLPFYDRLPEGSGYIDASGLEPGDHELKIVTWDLAGNESTLTGILAVAAPTHK